MLVLLLLLLLLFLLLLHRLLMLFLMLLLLDEEGTGTVTPKQMRQVQRPVLLMARWQDLGRPVRSKLRKDMLAGI